MQNLKQSFIDIYKQVKDIMNNDYSVIEEKLAET